MGLGRSNRVGDGVSWISMIVQDGRVQDIIWVRRRAQEGVGQPGSVWESLVRTGRLRESPRGSGRVWEGLGRGFKKSQEIPLASIRVTLATYLCFSHINQI